jgi:uncharacterized protein (TIGR03435 family)
MTRRSGGVGLGAALALFAPWLSAQTPAPLAFDVASVKANHSGDEPSSAFTQPGGRYTATNITVRALIKSAYGLHDDQLVDGPGWIGTDRFDIAAKAEGYSTPSAFRDAARLMLRPLLADRFTLQLRQEKREIPVYALVPSRPDGRFGPQLRRSDVSDCSGPAKAMPTVRGAAEPEAPLPCGAEIYRPGHLVARGMDISLLALNLSRYTERVVLGFTGLEGKFDWEIQWIPDAAAVEDASPPAGPGLVAALEDQAGLKLRGQRSPVDVHVVERAERPNPD